MPSLKIEQRYPGAPPPIQRALQGKLMCEAHIGDSSSLVYRASNGDHGLYLKTCAAAVSLSFAHEVRILHWLHHRLPVPEVVEYARDASYEYLILTQIPGENCVDAIRTHERAHLVDLLASGLRTVHSLDTSVCPFDERIAAKLEKARCNLDNNLVDEDDFDEERRDMTGRDVFRALQLTRPPEDDLVFTHGDYCLPNIILRGDAVSGFVDLGRAGIADRYHDLAIASRSVCHNLGPDYERLFFESYGMDHVDEERVTYYRMMDELF